jgi:hypothetical protein
MAIEFNATMNQFVNWANRDGIGKTDLVHAKKTQGTLDNVKVAMSGNTADGIGFFASRRRSADIKELNNATRELFMRAVMDLFGATTIDGVPKSVRDKMKLSDYDGEGHPLSAHRIRSVAKAAKSALAAKAFAVSGTGKAATIFKGAVNAKLATFHGSSNEKAVALKNEMDGIAKNRFNMYLVADMKDLQDGVESQFEKDHMRMTVAPKFKIGNETLTFDKNTSLEDKKDIIAKFVKKDMDAKFADLEGADLNKAYAVMSIIGQRFAICMQEGVNRSLTTGQLRDSPIKVGQPNRDASNSPLSFSFGDDGSLRINYKSVYDKPQITHIRPSGERINQRVFEDFDEGSSLTYTADVEIDAAEFERMANTDYTTFDYQVTEAAMHGQPDENEAGAASLGQYRFGEGVKVSVTCTAVLNGGEMMMDDEF